MRKFLSITACVLLLISCYKDEVDIAALNDNPFDREYEGPSVFELDSTKVVSVTVEGQTFQQQEIYFNVREDLFLAPATYSVHVREPGSSIDHLLNPDPPGSNSFTFRRQLTPAAEGETVCIDVALSNNQTTARKDVLCATL